MTQTETDFVKNIIEALLFISEKPVPLEQIQSVLEEIPAADIRRTILDLKTEYEENKRGMIIMEIAGGYQMLSSPHYTDAIRRFFKKKVKEKLSSPALETLAIIAYKQPVSRADIEQIRGVNSDGVVAHLLSKGLIKVVGRKEVPGRPYIYGTTKQFLEYFGLKSLRDLPKLEDFPSLFTSSGDVKSEYVQERDASDGGDGLREEDEAVAGDTSAGEEETIPSIEPAVSAGGPEDAPELAAEEPPRLSADAFLRDGVSDPSPEGERTVPPQDPVPVESGEGAAEENESILSYERDRS